MIMLFNILYYYIFIMPYASHVYMHINIWPIPRVDEEKYYGVDEEKYCRRNFLHRLGTIDLIIVWLHSVC